MAHPCLLFSDITATYGYIHRAESPYSTYLTNFTTLANSYDNYDYTDAEWYAAQRNENLGKYAAVLGFAYQLTGTMSYAEKAKECLLNCVGNGVDPYGREDALAPWRAMGLANYCLAYDWIYNTLTAAEIEDIEDYLAIEADWVYYYLYHDYNDNTNYGYISFQDYQGRIYPNLGIAGLALIDWADPNGLGLASGKADWLACGTTRYFTDDTLRPYDRGHFDFGFDPDTGIYTMGDYRYYVFGSNAMWFQVYSAYYGHSICDDYATVETALISDLWSCYPSAYSGNYTTMGMFRQHDPRYCLNLIGTANRAAMLNHFDLLDASPALLDYSDDQYSTFQYGYDFLKFILDPYTSTTRTDLTQLHLFTDDGYMQVIKSGWDGQTDDHVSIHTKTSSAPNNQNSREIAHHDQFNIEWYSRGDLLLADAGEPKHAVSDYTAYGQLENSHNVIAIEDPRTPFTTSTWGDSAARGVFKGFSSTLYSPITNNVLFDGDFISIYQGSMNFDDVISNTTWGAKQTLTSAIDWDRAVIHPSTAYTAVIDRLEGSETWVYRNLWRPSGIEVMPTLTPYKDAQFYINEPEGVTYGMHLVNVSEIQGDTFSIIASSVYDYSTAVGEKETTVYVNGNNVGTIYVNGNVAKSILNIPTSYLVEGNNYVTYYCTVEDAYFSIRLTYIKMFGWFNGTLDIGGTSGYDWEALDYKDETATGITTDTIQWTNTTPYGDTVTATLFSLPESPIYVTKTVGRIGGYDMDSEVYTPLVSFVPAAATSLYRVTILSAATSTETAPTISEESVIVGTGNCAKIAQTGFTEYIFTGDGGASTFSTYETDAEIAFIKDTGSALPILALVNGSYIKDDSAYALYISQDVTYAALENTATAFKFSIKGSGSAITIEIPNIAGGTIQSMTIDGASFTNWSQNGTTLSIITDLSEHDFVASFSEGSAAVYTGIALSTLGTLTCNSLTIDAVTFCFLPSGDIECAAVALYDATGAELSIKSDSMIWLKGGIQIGD